MPRRLFLALLGGLLGVGGCDRPQNSAAQPGTAPPPISVEEREDEADWEQDLPRAGQRDQQEDEADAMQDQPLAEPGRRKTQRPAPPARPSGRINSDDTLDDE
jgi:hypothetical protein